MIFIINFFPRVNLCAWFYIQQVSSYWAMICIAIFFKVLMNLSAIADFPSLCVECIFISLHHYSAKRISLTYHEIYCFRRPILCLVSVLIHLIFLEKTLVILVPFLSFKEITHAYLLKILITHNKKQILWLNLLINYISTRPAPEILPIQSILFLFLNFLIISLCNSSGNFSLDIISFLIAPPTGFFLF